MNQTPHIYSDILTDIWGKHSNWTLKKIEVNAKILHTKGSSPATNVEELPTQWAVFISIPNLHPYNIFYKAKQ